MAHQEINETILQDYVNKVCHHSHIAADTVKAYFAGIEKSKTSKQELGAISYAEVLLEFVTFFLHFTDRCLFYEVVSEGSAGIELRDNLMDELVERCISSGVDYCFFGLKEHAKQEYKKSSFKIHNTRMKEYNKYKKAFAERDEGLKNTLFWEFSKNICRLVKRQHDPILKNICIKAAVETLTDIDPNSLTKKIKKLFFRTI